MTTYNNTTGSAWHTSLFDFKPFDLCLSTYFCPCIVYGKTKALREDPSKLDDKAFNKDCGLWFLLSHRSGADCLLSFLNRQDIRKQYNIAGTTKDDFLASWLCRCCALMQERREVEYQISRKKEVESTPPTPATTEKGGMEYKVQEEGVTKEEGEKEIGEKVGEKVVVG